MSISRYGTGRSSWANTSTSCSSGFVMRSVLTIVYRYYANYVKFFTSVVADLGASAAIEEYVFAPAANGNEASMLLRFVGGA